MTKAVALIGLSLALVVLTGCAPVDQQEHEAYMNLKAKVQGLQEDLADLKESQSFGCAK